MILALPTPAPAVPHSLPKVWWAWIELAATARVAKAGDGKVRQKWERLLCPQENTNQE